jgi:phospholipase/lecithinase/hemolysin
MSGRLLPLAAAATLTIATGQATASSPFSAIYSFGDSLSDVGNVYLATGGLEPASPYVAGQFSNGPVWVQDLAALMGLPALSPSLTGGNDYAWGGATTGSPYTNNPEVPNLTAQVESFVAGHPSAPSTALYTFSFGANDLFAILGGMTGGLTPQQAVAYAAQTTASDASDLRAAGATDLMLFGVPNLGLTPKIQDAGVPGLPAEASLLSQEFNADLLSDLSGDGLTVFYIDAYDLLTDVVNDPGKYGFTNAIDPCWTGNFYGSDGTLCSLLPAVQDQYVFWDSVHPTEGGHRLIADAGAALIGVAVPEPSSWAMMLLGSAGLGFAGYRASRKSAASPA